VRGTKVARQGAFSEQVPGSLETVYAIRPAAVVLVTNRPTITSAGRPRENLNLPVGETATVLTPTGGLATPPLCVHRTLTLASRMVTRVREADAFRMNVFWPIDLGNLYATVAWYARFAIGNTPVAVVGAAPQAAMVTTAPIARTARTTEPARLSIAAAYHPSVTAGCAPAAL